jgi:hypothetical protein
VQCSSGAGDAGVRLSCGLYDLAEEGLHPTVHFKRKNAPNCQCTFVYED